MGEYSLMNQYSIEFFTFCSKAELFNKKDEKNGKRRKTEGIGIFTK
jgi:hypothetical protein